MAIKPYSNYLNTIKNDVDNFPALKVFFNHKDYNVAEQSWTDRVSGIKVTFKDALTVDADEGIAGDQDNETVSMEGAIPAVSSHLVVGITGRLEENSPELVSSLGNLATEPPSFTTNGLVFGSDGLYKGGAGALSPAAPVSGETRTGTMAQADLIDSTSPKISALQSIEGWQDIGFASGTTTDTNQIAFGGLFTSFYFTPLVNEITPDWFLRTFYVFDFAEAVSDAEMKIANTEMVRTGELFAGWRNRN